MKKILFVLLIAAFFTACNDGADVRNGYNVLHIFAATPEERALLTDNGFYIGDTLVYTNLTVKQKVVFNQYGGLDSNKCYLIEH